MRTANFWLALRFVRTHRAESFASVLMALLASLLSVATVAGIILYDSGVNASLEQPGYLELTVSPFTAFDSSDVPVVPLEDRKPDPGLLSLSLVGDVLATCPSIVAGWQSSHETLTATDNPDADLGGRIAGGAPRSGRMGTGMSVVTTSEVKAKEFVPGVAANPGGGPPADDAGEVAKTAAGSPEAGSVGAPPDKAVEGSVGVSGVGFPFGAAGEGIFPRVAKPADQDAGGPVDVPVLSEIPVRKVTPEFFGAYGLRAEEGVLFTQEDMEANRPLLVLGADLARRLFADGKAYGRRARFDGVIYTVAGILESAGPRGPGRSIDDSAFTAPASFPAVLSDGSVFMKFGVAELCFMPKSGTHADLAFRELASFLDNTFGSEVVSVRTPRRDLLEQKTMIDRIFTVTGILAALCLAAAALNTLGLSYLKVERMKVGLGIARATGASRNDVLSVFSYESLLLSFVGAVPGSLAGFFIARAFTGFYFPESSGAVPAVLIPAAFAAAALCLLLPVAAVLVPVSGSTAAGSTGFMVRE